MKVIEDYTTDKEMEAILAKRGRQGGFLKEIQNHFDGNHLVFDMPDTFDWFELLEGLKLKLKEKGVIE